MAIKQLADKLRDLNLTSWASGEYIAQIIIDNEPFIADECRSTAILNKERTRLACLVDYQPYRPLTIKIKEEKDSHNQRNTSR